MSATHVYIGRCPKCNAVPFAMIDSPDDPRRTAREVAHELRLGSIIERVPIEHLRDGTVGISRCACESARAEGKEATQ